MSEKITISESELNKMILKEVNRVKRIVMLEGEKKSVLKKLNELYESEDVDENWLNGKANRDKALQIINGHPQKAKAYQDWLKRDPAIAEQIVQFVMSKPDSYFMYDKAQNKIIDASTYKAAGGGEVPLEERKK